MIRGTAGPEGMRFFPFVFTLFMFILTLNMIALIPHTFSVTSQIIITAALALTVFFYGGDLRICAAWFPFLQCVRTQGRADLYSAAHRGDRDIVFHLAAAFA